MRRSRVITPTWVRYVTDLKEKYPLTVTDDPELTPQYAIALLSQMTDGNALVTLGVGQHQMWAMQHYQVRQPRSFLSSSGFGTMGFGLPAAIGAKIGCPERMVIDIDGDGSLNMTIHELSTCHRYGVGVKVVVINNQWLGMVRQWQDMIYRGSPGGKQLERSHHCGQTRRRNRHLSGLSRDCPWVSRHGRTGLAQRGPPRRVRADAS